MSKELLENYIFEYVKENWAKRALRRHFHDTLRRAERDIGRAIANKLSADDFDFSSRGASLRAELTDWMIEAGITGPTASEVVSYAGSRYKRYVRDHSPSDAVVMTMADVESRFYDKRRRK